MKKRFMLATEDVSKFEEELIVNYCKQNQFGWWHWLSNFWLLYTDDESMTTETLRDQINELFVEKKNMMVMEVASSEAENWAGFGKREMFEWLQSSWKED